MAAFKGRLNIMGDEITQIVKFDIGRVSDRSDEIMYGWVTAARKEKVPEEQIIAVIDECDSRDYQYLRRIIERHSRTE